MKKKTYILTGASLTSVSRLECKNIDYSHRSVLTTVANFCDAKSRRRDLYVGTSSLASGVRPSSRRQKLGSRAMLCFNGVVFPPEARTSSKGQQTRGKLLPPSGGEVRRGDRPARTANRTGPPWNSADAPSSLFGKKSLQGVN